MNSSVIDDIVDAGELREVEMTARVEIARKVGVLIRKEKAGEDEEAAIALAKLLVEDASISVREALAKELRYCRFIPDDLLHTLINDIDQVSVPFLLASDAVTDEFLSDMLSKLTASAQEAIAQRKAVSEHLSFTICDIGEEEAVAALMENEEATVSDRGYKRVVSRFPDRPTLLERLAKRANVSVEIAEQIVFKISRQYSEYLISKLKLAPDYATYLTTQAQRRVFNETLEYAADHELINYLQQLHAVGGLTSDSLLGYLQYGTMRLFYASISILLERPYSAVAQGLSTGDKALLTRMLGRIGYTKQVVGVLGIAFERHFNNRA